MLYVIVACSRLSLGLFLVLFSLALNELSVIEVVDLHGFAHLVHGLCGSLTRAFRALLEDVVYLRYVLLILMTALADGV